MSCAATPSRTALRPSRRERPLPRARCRRLRSCTAHPRAPPAIRSGLRAAARNARRAPSSRAAFRRRARAGRPPARPVATPRSAPRSRRIASHSRRARSWSAAARRASIILPTATPIRRVPKSNASTVASSFAAADATRHACPTSSDRREKSMPRRRMAAGSRASTGVSNSTPGSAATVSQAFCAISCSSWPADQPA